jgi:hypothetical protein
LFFYAIHAQGNKENEINLFITTNTEPSAIGTPPQLTVEMLRENEAFNEFERKGFSKIIVDYRIFKKELDISQIEEAELNNLLQSYIDHEEAALTATSELVIMSSAKGGKKGQKKKKRKMSKLTYALIGGMVALSMVLGVGVGMFLGSLENAVDTLSELINDNDGLIMPDAIEFCPNAELLTVSIDRSWSAVPREDLQVKGELINGVASVTLPAFDRNEFFSHVPGYTWGFTSDPNGRRIEFYGGQTYEFTENIKLYRVLVKYGGGNGTKEDPYLINYFDQLQLMSLEQARGYFRQTENIVFPCWTFHVPINTVNELKRTPDLERFEYDGGGFTISGLTAPLFGTVSGAVIRNVNITGSFIEIQNYENFGFIVSGAYNYRYEVDGVTYETGETLIQNSTVSYSTIHVKLPATDDSGNPLPENIPPVQPPAVVPPDVELPGEIIVTPPKHGEFAIGSITGVGGQIENCFVTNVLINAELPDYFLYVGGISGKPANVINSGVNNLTIRGNIFHAGGIVGSAGGTRLYSADGAELPIFYGGNIQGCFVRNFEGFVENSAGGIVGEGSANAENALISNCYAAGLDFRVGIFEETDRDRQNPIRAGIVGGIIGTDGNENYGHLVVNTVSCAYYPVIGFISKSRFDDTVRLAPANAFYQAGILDVMNRNTVYPNAPAVIFTGRFMFAEDERNNDNGGAYAFPSEIAGLFEKTVTEVNHG